MKNIEISPGRKFISESKADNISNLEDQEGIQFDFFEPDEVTLTGGHNPEGLVPEFVEDETEI